MRLQTIHQVSKQYQITPRTLRFYEDIGLLTASRDRSNRRCYSATEITMLGRILRLKRFGLNLDEIGTIVNAPDGLTAARRERALIPRGISRIKEQLVALEANLAEAERFLAAERSIA